MKREFSRTYQGRVVRAHLIRASTREGIELPTWKETLWEHHTLFQTAVNYYLLCIVAAAGQEHAILKGLFERFREFWDSKDRGSVASRVSLAEWIAPGRSHCSFDEACQLVLAGNTARSECLSLAVSLLLSKAQGESGIQQNGRTYWPRFCNPKCRPTWDFSSDARVAAEKSAHLITQVHSELAEKERIQLALEMDLTWARVKIDPEKPPRVGVEAHARIKEAAQFFLNALTDEDVAETRWAKWLTARADARALLEQCLRSTDKLPDEIAIPINRKAAQQFTFGALLFKYFPSRFTQNLLAQILGEPATEKKKKKTESKLGEIDYASLGDDPIKLARRDRGYVFRAFTALPQWGSADAEEIKWSEYDIAAFKQALVVLNQFRLKTEERQAQLDIERKCLAYIDGKTKQWTPPPDATDAEPPGVLSRDDARYKRAENLKKKLQTLWAQVEGDEERHRPFSPRARRNLNELIEKWNNVVQPGEPFSDQAKEKLDTKLHEFKKEHTDSMGSHALFDELVKEGNWCLWQEPTSEDAELRVQNDWPDDTLALWDDRQERVEEIERLEEPIRFTAAHPLESPRLFMFSDLAGKSAANHTSKAVEVSIAKTDQGSWREQRVRLFYSAPRLRRDFLAAADETPDYTSRWLPPVLVALTKLDEAPVQDFSNCAVSLMPDEDPAIKRVEDRDAPFEPSKARYLVNFPLVIDVGVLRKDFNGSEEWKGQFNGSSDSGFLHLHWPETLPPKYETEAWWTTKKAFSVLAIDLGQRVAAAAALLEAADKPDYKGWKIGDAGGKEWHARLKAMRHLRLPGENCEVWDGKEQKFKPEPHGANGRKATPEEYAEAMDILRRLRVDGENEMPLIDPDSERYFPLQNQHLLRALRRAQGHLARLQGWLCILNKGDEKAETDASKEISEQEIFPELKPLLKTSEPDDEPLKAELKKLIEYFRSAEVGIPAQLVRMANRVLPLRGRRWQWIPNTEAPEHNWMLQPTKLGEDRYDKKLRGQRGLSIPRIEQLEDLRRRCQALNRALQRPIGGPAKFGSRDEVPDPCPEVLRKLRDIKEQRVNQTAHLILAEALGVRLRGPQTPEAERGARDVHGEYEKIPARDVVDFIVMEDLSRYRTSQGRAPSENTRLMRWCHRAIAKKLKELCEPLGIPVLETPPGYSSKFCSRTGVAGFRAVEVGPDDRMNYHWRKLLAQAKEKGNEASAEAKAADQLFRDLEYLKQFAQNQAKPLMLLAPFTKGNIFVPAKGSKPMQADLNAAINLGLRAIASPKAVHILSKLRAQGIEKGVFIPIEKKNRRETALFSGAAGKKRFMPVDGADFKDLSKRNVNFFVDLGEIATFDQAQHEALPGVRLASGRGLWKCVKDLQWKRCQEINKARVEAAKKAADDRDRIE